MDMRSPRRGAAGHVWSGVRLGPRMEAERAPADRERSPLGHAIGPIAVRDHPPIKLFRFIGRNRPKHRAYASIGL